MEGGSGGGNDVELLSKTLQFEHKLFYFDLKENPWGRYLKISEKTSTKRSTIIVPFAGIAWFIHLFNYFVNTDWRDSHSKELMLDTKVYCFDIGKNKSGRFFMISEASASRSRSRIIAPAGSSGKKGWTAFQNILVEINNEASRLFIVPNQQNIEPPDHLPGLSDDVGAGFISGHSAQPAPGSDLHIDRLLELLPQDAVGILGLCKEIRADQKRFFFDLRSNNRGHFLRISEVSGSDRSSIFLPLSGLKQFRETIGHFVEITKDILEGMTSLQTVGSSGKEGWTAFQNILVGINNEASRLFIVLNQSPDHLPGLSDDVSAAFISGHSAQPAPGSDLHVDRLLVLPPQDVIGIMGLCKVIRADQKRFIFYLGSNNRGHFLRISEVLGADRSSIFLPLSGLKQFHETIGHFMEITSLQTVEPTHR